jgi:peptidyl-prolyl cis-trans isomerase SurA
MIRLNWSPVPAARRSWLPAVLALIALAGPVLAQSPPDPASPAPAPTAPASTPVLLEQIVATVDDEVILLSEIVADLQFHAMQAGQLPPPDEQRALLEQARTGRIQEKLLVAKARRDQIQIGDEDLDQALDGHIANLRKQAGSDSRFLSELAREGLTERDLRKNLREPMREQMLAQRVIERVAMELTVSDEELQRYYDENRNDPERIPLRPRAVELSHLVVLPQAAPEQERALRAKLEEAQHRLAAGEDFATVAIALSQDPAAARGGDLGWWELKDIALPELAMALANLPPGQRADEVRSEQGYHILKMEEREGQRVHFRQIFFPLPLSEADRQAARDRAREAWQRLQEGADWAATVLAYSDDAPTREQGGRLPVIPEEQLDERYRSVVEALEPGEYSGVFLGRQGYQILRLEARDAARPYSLPEVTDQLRAELVGSKRNQAIEHYLVGLEQEMLVTRFDLPPLSAIAGLAEMK